MKNLLKNIGFYWTVILLPFMLIIFSYFFAPAQLAFSLLLFYCLLYPPFVDYIRLQAIGVIEVKFWKLYLPFYRAKYFQALYQS